MAVPIGVEEYVDSKGNRAFRDKPKPTSSNNKQRITGGDGNKGVPLGDPSGVSALEGADQRKVPSLGEAVRGVFGEGFEGTKRTIGNVASFLGGEKDPIASKPYTDTPGTTSSTASSTTVPTKTVADTASRTNLGDVSTDQDAFDINNPTKVTQTLGGPGKDGLNRFVLNVDTGAGGTASVSSTRAFSPERLGELERTIAFNQKQSTKDRFARDARETEERNAKYGSGLPDLETRLRDQYNRELSKPFRNLGVLDSLSKQIGDVLQQKAGVSSATADLAKEQRLGAKEKIDQTLAAKRDISDVRFKALKSIQDRRANTLGGNTLALDFNDLEKGLGGAITTEDVIGLLPEDKRKEYDAAETPEDQVNVLLGSGILRSQLGRVRNPQ
ncbi:hypothetical protein [Caudoviricetes sp.]|nr:hypothetical protein [Caudoviricetes sp.]